MTHIEQRAEQEEEWRAVVGYEGIYEVSSSGRVKRVLAARGTAVGRLLSPFLSGPVPQLYLHVNLYERPGCYRTCAVHRLVAAAFIGPRPFRLEVDHIDRDSNNNDASNLRYVTSTANGINRDKQLEYAKRTCTSRFKGVDWDSSKQKWRATITRRRKQRFLGYYNREEDAANAHKIAARKWADRKSA